MKGKVSAQSAYLRSSGKTDRCRVLTFQTEDAHPGDRGVEEDLSAETLASLPAKSTSRTHRR